MSDTGNKATITFPGGAVAAITKIKPGKFKRGTIRDDVLSTDQFMELMPEDLVEIEEIEVGYRFDPGADIPSIHEPPGAITITWGLRTGQATAANLAGSGFMTELDFPELMNNTRQEGTLKFQFDGKANPPVFTPAAAA